MEELFSLPVRSPATAHLGFISHKSRDYVFSVGLHTFAPYSLHPLKFRDGASLRGSPSTPVPEFLQGERWACRKAGGQPSGVLDSDPPAEQQSGGHSQNGFPYWDPDGIPTPAAVWPCPRVSTCSAALRTAVSSARAICLCLRLFIRDPKNHLWPCCLHPPGLRTLQPGVGAGCFRGAPTQAGHLVSLPSPVRSSASESQSLCLRKGGS